jgi:hypothetical protein
MEFEEMQIIWNRQKDARLFAIDEDALYRYIQGKSRSTGRWLRLVEWMMIAVNLIAGILLAADAIRDGGPILLYAIAAMYLAYSVVGVFRRLSRRSQEVQFEDTMLGELDKGIWRIDYLIRQGHSLILWYLLPLLVVATAVFLLNGKLLLALAMLLLLPLTYFGGRWETERWHRPKKQSLEALRETLLAAEANGESLDRQE